LSVLCTDSAFYLQPPRLNGEKTGLFSTRSPHRPNPIGLSLAKVDGIDTDGGVWPIAIYR
jgi:tRNA (Thr-GGU) A37 N-methylase